MALLMGFAKGTQFLDNSGNPLARGTLTFYEADTSTLATITSNGSTAAPNPATLDGSGRLTSAAWCRKTVDVVVKDSTGATVANPQDIVPVAPQNVGDVTVQGAALDGVTDDTAALQAAIDAVGSGGNVVIPPGTLAFTTVTADNDIRFTGYGTASKLKQLASAATGAIILTNKSRISFSDLYFDMTVAGAADSMIYGTSVDDLSVDRCYFFGDDTVLDKLGGAVFVSGSGSDRLSVTNCTFINIAAENVRLQANNEIIVAYNTFRNIKKASGFSNRPIIVGQSQRVVIIGNVINGVEAASTMYAIDVGNADNLIVMGNNVYSAAGGINLENINQRVVISGNVFHGTYLSGMHGIQYNTDVDEPEDVVITGNVIDGFDDGIRGNQCDDMTVTGNVITNCFNRSIFNGTSQDTRRMLITGNRFASNGTGGGLAFDVIMTDAEDRGALIANNFFEETGSIRARLTGSATYPVQFRDNINIGSGVLDTAGALARGNLGATTIGTFTDADATPSIAGRSRWLTANTGATTITAFDDGGNGTELLIVFGDANTTIAHGSNIKLSGSANYAPAAANSTLSLVMVGGVWVETGRSDL